MYLAMMSSAVCADSGRAKSANPASLRRVFRMGSPRRDTVFDSGSPKIVVSGAPQGPSWGINLAVPPLAREVARRMAPDSKAARSAQAASGAFANGLGSGAVVSRRRKGLRIHGDVVEADKA